MSDYQATDALTATLAEINGKLDYVVRRQRMVEDLISEMTPILREAINGSAGTLTGMENRGYFAIGRELLNLVDQIVSSTTPEDVRALADSVGAILATVRNLTQPDVLAMANETAEVLHHADSVKPIGVFGALRASNDEDVQRGLGLAVQILRHLGKAQISAAAAAPRLTQPAHAASQRAAQAAPAHHAPTHHAPQASASEPATHAATVEWEGAHFNADGFLLDPGQWTEALAEKMAAALGITLSPDHWTAIRWARQDFLASGASPNVRRVASGSGLGTRRVYEIFPNKPGKTCAMLAGVPKPVGCV